MGEKQKNTVESLPRRCFANDFVNFFFLLAMIQRLMTPPKSSVFPIRGRGLGGLDFGSLLGVCVVCVCECDSMILRV